MQCKDISDAPILAFLAKHAPHWCFVTDYEPDLDNYINHAFPPGTPFNLIMAKLRSLVRRGLIDGCTCGCRGDFEITPKGRHVLEFGGGA